MASLDFLVGVKVALVEFAVGILEFADLTVGKLLEHVRSVISKHIVLSVIPRLRQQPLILHELLVASLILILLYPHSSRIFRRCLMVTCCHTNLWPSFRSGAKHNRSDI